jgi:uncharacterized protein YfaS (alpha-2-macroglobulin family)
MKSSLLLFLAVCLCTLTCKKEPQAKQTSTMIAGYTSGMISAESAIRIRFKEKIVDSSMINLNLKKSPFSFKPGIKGHARWLDQNSLEFKPQEKLPGGTEYQATLNLSSLMEIMDGVENFSFSFKVIRQSFEITVDGLQALPDNPKQQIITGRLTTADVENPVRIEKVLTATQEDNTLTINWNHEDDKRTHIFTINNIERKEDESGILLEWDGSLINVEKKGSSPVAIPALNSFSITGTRAVQAETEYIEIRFSDALQKNQNLTGLVQVDNETDLRFTIEGSILKIYNPGGWSGSVQISLSPGIRNIFGYRLKKEYEQKLLFEELKPQVRFGSKGVIIPSAQNLKIPIETVNLNAIIVEATQIFEDNMAQFLQINSLDRDNELHRVGRVVWKKTVPLNLTPDRHNRWLRSGLDISPLLQNNPGGMYRIQINFKQNHIYYHCAQQPAQPENREEEDVPEWETGDESSNWDYYQEDFDWQDYYDNRYNPCHPAYYRHYYDHDITVTRNVLVSDIGIITKSGSDNRLFIACSDLSSARPLSGISLSVLDYQQQKITQTTTDQDGMAYITLEHNPFIVIAKKGSQTGYLRLDPGQSLSISHFDVAGDQVQKGLKGFIYGERGVWRPGDDIHLTFILFDRDHLLPEKHPVQFELRNARNQMVKKLNNVPGLNGFHTIKITTGQDDPTGNWLAKFRIGGVIFEKILKVETVMPNRLKIKLDFDSKITALDDGSFRGTLSALWLHGAVAKNLKADMEVAFRQTRTLFKKFEAFSFDDPARRYEPETIKIYEGLLNEKGIINFSTSLHTRNRAPGMLQANFLTRVFEQSGAFSVDRFTMPYHPYDQYVGIQTPKGDKRRGMLLTDTTHTVSLAGVDKDGNPITSARVEIKLYKIKWRWWWERGEDNIADYIESRFYQPLERDTVKIFRGKGEWKFKIKYPSWGRYLIRARDLHSGHSTGKIVYIDWPGWAGRAQKEGAGGASVLTFSSDKEYYQVGETAQITLPVTTPGRILVSLETGSKVLRCEWLEAKDNNPLQYTLPITSEMAPGIYVHATFIQPHQNLANDLPIRMYGVIPLAVTDRATRLKPLIACEEVLKPQSQANIAVSEEQGRTMTYTLAVVDEGLLDITRFATPNPWDRFFRREALGVHTWDLYDLVVGAYGASLEQLLAIGGDGQEEIEGGEKKAKRFPPVVRFLGPFELNAKSTNKHTVDIPQYVGALRVMVVAGNRTAFGSTEKSVVVRQPLMVLGTLPRVLGPNETVHLPVAVFALEDKIKHVQIFIRTAGPLKIAGSADTTITFTQPEDKLVTFILKSSLEPGMARLVIAAEGHGEKAEQEIAIDVRNPNKEITETLTTDVPPGKMWQQNVALFGMPGTNKITLEVSRIPPINLGKRLRFLIRYPYGCIEQTTSSVFPQLYLDKLLQLSPEKQQQIEKNVTAGIQRLRYFQMSDGGFGYWPGAQSANTWSSNYAGHFLVEAQRLGYTMPAGLIENWLAYQQKQAQSWITGPERSELIQAYRLHTLALAGKPELGAMNRLREQNTLPNTARWRLAAAYTLAGQKEAAEELIRDTTLSIKPYREMSNTYGSDLRDKAMVLEALVIMQKEVEAEKLAKELSEALSNEKWLSTQTTAYALIALARKSMLTDPDMPFTVSYQWQGNKGNVSSKAPIIQSDLPVDSGEIVLNNDNEYTIYPRIILSGIPLPGKEHAAANGMELDVTYLTADKQSLDPANLEQGTDFLAQVTVTNTGRTGTYEEIALAQIFPSGWEIRNIRLDPSTVTKSSLYEYQDIRDDRVFTFFDIKQSKSKTFEVMLNASYLGKFYMPMVSVEAMYDATISAHLPGQWITITTSGSP